MSLTFQGVPDQSRGEWQRLTHSSGLELVRKLPFTYDPVRLEAEYREVVRRYPMSAHTAASGWRCTGLIAEGGDYREIRLKKGVYSKTELVQHTPYIESILDSMLCEKRRVRFAVLMPGYVMDWHFDRSGGEDLVRLHVPIVTNDQAFIQVSHDTKHFKPGEVWYVDVGFPHRSHNGGTDPKVHLIMELVVNDFVRDLLGPGLDGESRNGWRINCQAAFRYRSAGVKAPNDRLVDRAGTTLG